MTRNARARLVKFAFIISSAVAMFTIVPSGWAQEDPPFFGGGGFGFDPEIDVVNSGALLDAQVVVSEDRRYVTINARPSLSRIQNFFTFPVAGFVNGPGGAQFGFVGGAGYLPDEDLPVEKNMPQPKESAAGAERKAGKKAGPVPRMPVAHSPSEILNVDTTAATSVLRQEGMFLISTGN